MKAREENLTVRRLPERRRGAGPEGRCIPRSQACRAVGLAEADLWRVGACNRWAAKAFRKTRRPGAHDIFNPLIER
jgi:hypothetical protein